MKPLPKNVKINDKDSLVLVDSVGKEWNLDEIYGIIEDIREKEDREFEEYSEQMSQTIPVKDRLKQAKKIFGNKEGNGRFKEFICD